MRTYRGSYPTEATYLINHNSYEPHDEQNLIGNPSLIFYSADEVTTPCILLINANSGVDQTIAAERFICRNGQRDKPGHHRGQPNSSSLTLSPCTLRS